jgi:hypothetical protein
MYSLLANSLQQWGFPVLLPSSASLILDSSPWSGAVWFGLMSFFVAFANMGILGSRPHRTHDNISLFDD